MYEDIFELVTIAAQKRNLKESTAKAYCHALSPFLNAIGKPWQELTIADVDDYLTAKRLVGIMPEVYLHVSNKTLLGIKSPFDVQENS